MKRFIKHFLLFTALSLPIWLGVIFLLSLSDGMKYQPLETNVRFNAGEGSDYLIRKLVELDSAQPVDVVVLGSSHAYRGFDPRIWKEKNISLYNLGSSSQSFIQSWYMCEHYIDRLNPKLVVIEVNPFMLSADGLESTISFIPKAPMSASIVRTTFLTNHITAYNALAYVAIEKWRDPPVYKTKDHKIHTYIPGGFVERAISFNKGRDEHKPEDIDVNFSQHLSLSKAIRMLKDRGIEVVLIQAPITRKMYASIENPEEVDDYFSGFDGVSYYNVNAFGDFDDRNDFFDAHHLNQHGVVKLQDLLFDRVAEFKQLVEDAKEQ